MVLEDKSVFGWMDRKSEPWSLATLKLPWGKAQSLCDLIVKDPRTPLPEEDPAAGIKWAAGALDGVMGHHAGCVDGTEDLRRVLRSLRGLLAKASDAALEKVYDAACKTPLLGYVEELLPAIETQFSSDRVRLAALARLFVTEAPRREAVKFGIAVLVQTGCDRAMMTEFNCLFQSKHCSKDAISTDRSSSCV
jgi:hypothetical protein